MYYGTNLISDSAELVRHVSQISDYIRGYYDVRYESAGFIFILDVSQDLVRYR